MTKLLLPVKTGGLETPCREIDTCHMHTHTHAHILIHCVQREYLLLVGGSFHVGDQSSMLTEGNVFRLRFNRRSLSPLRSSSTHPHVFLLSFLLFINWFVLLYLTSLPLCVADIAQRYRITKYPTLKLFRNGMMMKREYRGQRSVVAIADFIRQQQVDPVKEVHSLEELNTLDVSGKYTDAVIKIHISTKRFILWNTFALLLNRGARETS